MMVKLTKKIKRVYGSDFVKIANISGRLAFIKKISASPNESLFPCGT